VANPTAVVSSGAIQHTVSDSSVAYVEGDSVTTGSDSSATVNLTSGKARVVVAPNTVMSVLDADQASFSLTQGALQVTAEAGQVVTVVTSAGSYELASVGAIDAVAVFENGEFSAITKAGSLLVTSEQGSVVTEVEAGEAFVAHQGVAKSVDVQTAGTAGSGLNTVLIVGGVTVFTAVVAEEISDAGEQEVASPAL